MFSLLGSNYYAAQGEQAARREGERTFDVKSRQKRAAFGFGAQLLGLGSTLYDKYEKDQTLIDWADKSKILTKTSNIVTDLFGKGPQFEDLMGNAIDTETARSMYEYEKYNEQENKFDYLRESFHGIKGETIDEQHWMNKSWRDR